MACFDDFITYRGSGVTPTSGLYVNDLYGVYFTKADAIANTDYATGIELIESKIDLAVNYVAAELKRYVMPYFKINSIIAHYLGGEFDDDLGYHGVGTAARGLRIDIRESALSEIIINRVRLLFNDAGDYNVHVIDGTETTNYAVTLVAGEEQDVEINQRCDRNRVYITMDSTLHPAEGKASMGCCGSNYDILSVRGYTGSGLSSNHYGIRADISVGCNPTRMICVLKDFLGFPVLYRFGIEMANEALESDRINFFTLTNRDGILELRDRYQEDYTKSMSDLARSIPKLLRKLDDYCIMCNQAKYIEVTP